MEYRGVKIPKRNGRPQLWARGYGQHTTLRIIHPDGKVDWQAYSSYNPNTSWSGNGCTAAETQLQAIKNSIDYDKGYDSASKFNPWFLGYL